MKDRELEIIERQIEAKAITNTRKGITLKTKEKNHELITQMWIIQAQIERAGIINMGRRRTIEWLIMNNQITVK